MCPLCMTSAALMFAGTASAGGLTALVVRKLHLKARKTDAPERENEKEITS
jgi:hypothetical protein